MFDTLYHIPRDIAGLPVFGVGLLLAAWCLFGLIILIVAWRRGGSLAEWAGYLPLLVLVAAAIIWFLPQVCNERGLPIRGYGMMLLIAVVSATSLLAWRAKRAGLDPDMMVSMVFWMFIPGIIGARLFYVVEYWHEFHHENLFQTIGEILNFSKGGLVVYGSLIAGMLGMVVFVRKYRLPMLAICDLLAPSLLLGLAIGRIGCLAHGCCFGGPADVFWAIPFPQESPVYERQLARGQLWGLTMSGSPEAVPEILEVNPDSLAGKTGLRPGDRIASVNNHAVRSAGDVAYLFHDAAARHKPIRLETTDGRNVQWDTWPAPAWSLPVHPTQIYSSVNAFLLCFLLLAYAPFCRRDGQLFALMLTIYPITRFLLEVIRTDEGAVAGTGLSISQNVSLLILLAIAVLWTYILKQPRGRALPMKTESV